MVPLTVHRLREWPRLLASGLAAGIVLLGVGLLLGATVGATRTTLVHTVTATLTRESPVQAAQLQADGATIATLNGRLTVARHRLTAVERRLTVADRTLHRLHVRRARRRHR